MVGKDDFGSILDEVFDGRHGGSNARIISDDQLVINGTLRSAWTNTRLPLSSASPRLPTLFFLAIQTKARAPPLLLLPCPPIHIESRTLENREKTEKWVLTITTHLDDEMDE
jgi:hypothetical protein